MKSEKHHLKEEVTYIKKYIQDYTTEHAEYTSRQHCVQGECNHNIHEMQRLNLYNLKVDTSYLKEHENQGYDFFYTTLALT